LLTCCAGRPCQRTTKRRGRAAGGAHQDTPQPPLSPLGVALPQHAPGVHRGKECKPRVWVEFAHSVVAVCIDCIVATEASARLQCRSGHRPTPRLCTPLSLIHPHPQPSRDGARHVSVILRRVSLSCATDVVVAAQHSCVWPRPLGRADQRESCLRTSSLNFC
jgi:hypothetical protein